jgi:hypothetical protein
VPWCDVRRLAVGQATCALPRWAARAPSTFYGLTPSPVDVRGVP